MLLFSHEIAQWNENNDVNLTQDRDAESEFGLNSAAVHLAQDEGKFLRCIL